MLPVTITPNSINMLIDGRMRTISRDHVNFKPISDMLRRTKEFTDAQLLEHLRLLSDVRSFIAIVTEGRIKASKDAVYFNGEQLHGEMVKRFLEQLAAGYNVTAFARFMDNLLDNPSKAAREELYLWLEAGGMPITEDGHFIAFKKVRSDYTSSNTAPDGSPVYNRIGDRPSMPREECDDDRHATCSRGLHFCSYAYLPQFGVGGESRVMICKVNPRDVVSIPHDYSNTKGRACTYEIVGEVPEDEAQAFFAGRHVVDDYDPFPDEDVAFPDECEEEKYLEEAVSHLTSSAGDEDREEAPAPAPVRPKSFKHAGTTFTAKRVEKLIAKHGQRGAARVLDVPRTTLQGWAKLLK